MEITENFINDLYTIFIHYLDDVGYKSALEFIREDYESFYDRYNIDFEYTEEIEKRASAIEKLNQTNNLKKFLKDLDYISLSKAQNLSDCGNEVKTKKAKKIFLKEN